jgi:hypothetical protein
MAPAIIMPPLLRQNHEGREARRYVRDLINFAIIRIIFFVALIALACCCEHLVHVVAQPLYPSEVDPGRSVLGIIVAGRRGGELRQWSAIRLRYRVHCQIIGNSRVSARFSFFLDTCTAGPASISLLGE